MTRHCVFTVYFLYSSSWVGWGGGEGVLSPGYHSLMGEQAWELSLKMQISVAVKHFLWRKKKKKNFLWGKEISGTKKKKKIKKGSTSFSSTLNIRETYGAHSCMWVLPILVV